MNIIEIKNLYKIYGQGKNKTEALKNINLKIKKGEFIAIVGTSGSGKTTLLNIIGGLDNLTSGEVLIDGENIKKLGDRELALLRVRKIGFVFQSFNLISILSVEENIEMPVILDNSIMDENYKNELLKLLGLENKKCSLPFELSGGQQQRVAIGRALSNKPSIILADEPTGNLDSRTSKDIIELLKYTTRKYNQTLIIITHDENIAQMADRVISIEDGEIAKDEVI